MEGEEVSEGWVVRFSNKKHYPNDPQFEAKKIKSLELCFEGFKGALLLFNMLRSKLSKTLYVNEPYNMPLFIDTSTKKIEEIKNIKTKSS